MATSSQIQQKDVCPRDQTQSADNGAVSKTLKSLESMKIGVLVKSKTGSTIYWTAPPGRVREVCLNRDDEFYLNGLTVE
jgi:hypothetical protein